MREAAYNRKQEGRDLRKTWRSELYPVGWRAPENGSGCFYSGRMIQDFSFAGYRLGEAAMPDREGPLYTVTESRFGADPSGREDSTVAIQHAIREAEAAGGGVVFLPAGTYAVRPPEASACALSIGGSAVVLRGEGAGRTRLLCMEPRMRGKSIIRIAPENYPGLRADSEPVADVRNDLASPVTDIPVVCRSPFRPGEWVTIRADVTDSWIQEHGEPDWLGQGSLLGGPVYLRRIPAIDVTRRILVVDVPIRYAWTVRDRLRVHRAPGMLVEVGLESFSIGNVQHPGRDGWGLDDFATPGSSAYEVDGAHAITILGARNCWVRGVESFRAPGNGSPAHLLSNGLLIRECARITVAECGFHQTQYGGAGGNGYMYRLHDSSECLIRDCKASYCRHGYVLSHMGTSGNVIFRSEDRATARYAGATGREGGSSGGSDHHMHFCHSNLVDSCLAVDSYFEAAYRPCGSVPRHNLTAAHSVFWNIRGEGYPAPGDPSRPAYVVHSEQSRCGYVIGTSGQRFEVRLDGHGNGKTGRPDHVEGVGAGESLEPQSVFVDQRARRGLRPEPY